MTHKEKRSILDFHVGEHRWSYYRCTGCKETLDICWNGWPKDLSIRDLYSKGYVATKAVAEEINDYWYSGEIMLAEYQLWGYYCSECNALQVRPHIVFCMRDGRFYIPQFRCSSCSGVLLPVENISTVCNDKRCLHCGSPLGTQLF